jgi:hypothetical protein
MAGAFFPPLEWNYSANFHWAGVIGGLSVLKAEKAPLVATELVSLLANQKTHFVVLNNYSNAHGWAFSISKTEKYDDILWNQTVFLQCGGVPIPTSGEKA